MRGLLKRFGVLSVAASAVFVCARAGVAETFHSEKYGYTIELPGDWVEIPREVLDEAITTVFTEELRKKVDFDAGFQPSANTFWMEYPYIVIQITSYAKDGLNRQLNEDEFSAFVRSYTASNEEPLERDLSPVIKEMLRGIEPGQPVIDKANRRFFWPIELTVKDFGLVNGLIVGHFGREAMVQVLFYDRHPAWDSGELTRQAIIDSFRFDEDKAYSVEVAAAYAIGRWRPTPIVHVVMAVVGLGLIAGIGGTIYALIRMRFRMAGGIVLTTIGALMAFMIVVRAFNNFDLNDGDEFSRVIGAAAISGIALAGGLAMIKRARQQAMEARALREAKEGVEGAV